MQNRRNFLAQTSLAAGAFAFLKPLQTFAGNTTSASDTNNTLIIVYTAGLCEQWNHFNGLGGIEAITDAVKKIKRDNGNLLLVDAGNILDAGSKKNISHLHYFTALKKAGFDAMTPGINDMQHGADYFSKLAGQSNLKAVATNYHNKGILKESVLPFHITRKGHVKVGIIGIGSNTIGDTELLSASQLCDLVNTTTATLKQVHHCNVVICLSHLSLKSEVNHFDNLRLAEASSGIDMIISDNEQRFTHNTHVVKNKNAHDVFVTHAGKKGTILGRIDVSFNEHGQTIHIEARPIFTGIENSDTKAAFRKHAVNAEV
jgi:5'-nucleotidase